MIDPKEANRNRKRDKKANQRYSMKVNAAGRALAEIILNKLRRKK